MRCPTCKKPDTFRAWEGPIVLRGVQVAARGERCSNCGEILFDGSEVNRQEREVARVLVARGIRSGRDFKYVRKVAGLRAAEVAGLLDVRPETVSRWERDELEVPRLAAFALAELFEHPKTARERLALLSA